MYASHKRHIGRGFAHKADNASFEEFSEGSTGLRKGFGIWGWDTGIVTGCILYPGNLDLGLKVCFLREVRGARLQWKR